VRVDARRLEAPDWFSDPALVFSHPPVEKLK